jgi:predicted transcriptional regulator
MATKVVSIKLDETDQARLASLAEARQRSSHFLMREAIAEYLEREDKRAAFIGEAEAAWEHYQATGEHVTLDEIDAWANRLESEPDLPAPQCRK